MTFTNPVSHELVGVPLDIPLHPTQLYESVRSSPSSACFSGGFLKPHAPGAIISLYLMFYSSARFVVEFFRYHEQPNLFGGPLNTSQWISLALMALGAAHFVAARRRVPASV